MVEPKKTVVSSIRDRLLSLGYSERVEYDAINVEPVLIYDLGETKTIFVRHKWELAAQIPARVFAEGRAFSSFQKFLATDESGDSWLKFQLPSEEDAAIEVLEKLG